ncbi:unnamed protein product [Miscanthus lutarioriparius]|uniref:Atg6 BARA domain-containing protein n=1 Tax=Miscanthus lutarioriparius TaxID=422564 RepID=A0A811NV84_9POAL|nr:unnamed protein product [Miscanthus lutarioriparius]
MDFEIEDISSDIKAYEASLQHLEQESYSILSETDFQKEKQKIEEEEKKLRADIEEAEKQYPEVISEMKDLETKSKQFKELKEQIAHLELLKHTNVLNDAFYISHHGVFGTINNLRLGHSHEVEWDEINAAWGQVALLLHIMAQFGPANVLFSTRYDVAMTWFLRCLQEFVEFAVSLDKENNVPPDKSLKVPYKGVNPSSFVKKNHVTQASDFFNLLLIMAYLHFATSLKEIF